MHPMPPVQQLASTGMFSMPPYIQRPHAGIHPNLPQSSNVTENKKIDEKGKEKNVFLPKATVSPRKSKRGGNQYGPSTSKKSKNK